MGMRWPERTRGSAPPSIRSNTLEGGTCVCPRGLDGSGERAYAGHTSQTKVSGQVPCYRHEDLSASEPCL